MSAGKPTGRVPGAVAFDAQLGDIVQSRWSSSGAPWRIVDFYGRPGVVRTQVQIRAGLVSLKTGRTDTRDIRDLKIVEVHV